MKRLWTYTSSVHPMGRRKLAQSVQEKGGGSRLDRIAMARCKSLVEESRGKEEAERSAILRSAVGEFCQLVRPEEETGLLLLRELSASSQLLPEARALFAHLRSRSGASVSLYARYIEAASRSHSWEDARDAFAEASQKPALRTDVYLWAAMMDATLAAGKVDEVLALYTDMERRGDVRGSKVAVEANYVMALVQQGHLPEARAFLDGLLARGANVDDRAVFAYLQALRDRNLLLSDGWTFQLALNELGLSDPPACALFVEASLQNGDFKSAERAAAMIDLQSAFPDESSALALLHLAQKTRNLPLAEQVATWLEVNRLAPSDDMVQCIPDEWPALAMKLRKLQTEDHAPVVTKQGRSHSSSDAIDALLDSGSAMLTVFNLPPGQVRLSELVSLMARAGLTKNISLCRNGSRGRVRFASIDEALNALFMLHGSLYKGNRLSLEPRITWDLFSDPPGYWKSSEEEN